MSRRERSEFSLGDAVAFIVVVVSSVVGLGFAIGWLLGRVSVA